MERDEPGQVGSSETSGMQRDEWDRVGLSGMSETGGTGGMPQGGRRCPRSPRARLSRPLRPVRARTSWPNDGALAARPCTAPWSG